MAAEKKIKTLTKSKLMRGLQCEKNFWLHLHRPELEPEADAATQMQFDDGNLVGEKARELEGKGVLNVEDYWNYHGGHEQTAKAITDGAKLIFEASFLHQNLFARADILKKSKSGWELIEVKKSTSVKDYHLQDAAIQATIIEATGLKLSKIAIRHINSEMVYPKFKDLFTTVDVTEEVRELQKQIKKQMKDLSALALEKKEPKKAIGPHCADPFGCGFKDYCWADVPEKSVFDLPGLNEKKKWDLFNSGKEKISQLNAKDYSGKTARAIEVTKSKKNYVDNVQIEKELKSWRWPLFFFDFETIGPSIPRYPKTSPYNQVPFQFSCHVWKDRTDKKLDHFEYLHTEENDPRPRIIKAMLKGFGKKGSIVAYHKSFEIGVIKNLAEFDKENRNELLALIDRFVDPLPILRETVYHPEFLGSFSIKYVAPALIGKKLSYDGLAIADGGAAQSVAEMVLTGKVQGNEKAQLIDDLLTYCRQDTMAMVEIVKWLMKEAK